MDTAESGLIIPYPNLILFILCIDVKTGTGRLTAGAG